MYQPQMNESTDNDNGSNESNETTMFIHKYAETTKQTCMCTATAIILIMAFAMSPLCDFLLTSILCKIVIAVLLGYSIYKNTTQTTLLKNQFNKDIKSLLGGDFDAIKMNILCGYTFSAFLTFLLVAVLRH
jgi:hypothetical protein